MASLYGIIYKYTNKVNGKMYIGQTTQTMAQRRTKHRAGARQEHGRSQNMPFINALKKYGYENFFEEVLFSAFTKTDLDWAESYFICLFNTLNKSNGYNAKMGGSNGKHTVQSKEKIKQANFSEKKKAIYRSDAFRAQCRKNAIYLQTPESRKKAGLSKRGKAPTASQLAGLAIGRKRGLLKHERKHRCVISIKDGIELLGFRSIKDAAKFYNLHAAGISANLIKKTNTCGGMQWRYANGNS